MTAAARPGLLARVRDGELILDIGAAMARHVTGAAAGIVTIAVVARVLGASRLGAWTLLGTSSYVLGLADLGLATVVQRRLAARSSAAAATFALAIGAVVVVAPILAVVAFGLVRASVGPGADIEVEELRTAAGIAIGGGVAGAFGFPARAALLVRGGVREVSLARASGAALQVAVTAVATPAIGSLLAPAAALALALVVETALLARAVSVRVPELLVRPSWSSMRAELPASLREASAALVINGAVVVAARLDVFVLARVCPLPLVAAYGLATRACDQALLLAKQTSSALLGRLGEEKGRDASVRVGATWLHAIAGGGLGALAAFGVPLLTLWGGAAARPSSTVLALLASAAVLAAWSEIPSATVALGAPSPWRAATPILLGSAVNATLTVAVAWTGSGTVIAAASVVGAAVTTALAWSRVAGLLGWRARDVVRALGPGIVAIVVAALVGALASPGVETPRAALIASALTAILALGAALATRATLSASPRS